MSLNTLRVNIKKRMNRSNDGKSGRKSHEKMDLPSKQRKSSTTPEVQVSSPTHQLQTRKMSLNTDSPVHNRTPASPLVIKSSSVGNFRRDSSPNLSGSTPSQSTQLPTVIYTEDSQPLDRQGIIDITVDVQNFLASISRLKQAMEDTDSLTEGDEGLQNEGESTDLVLKRLSELVQVVQTCLGQHTAMQSTDITNTAMTLMQTYQDCPHMSAATCPDCSSAVDNLIDAFTRSVSEYLTGEAYQLPVPQRKALEKSSLSHSYLKGFSKSHDNLAGRYNSYLDLTQPISDDAIVDQIDQSLSEVHGSVDVANKYLKTRIKYHREVVTYLTKRAQIETQYYKQLSKLGKSTQSTLKELKGQEPSLPLFDLVRGAIEQDMRFASNCNATYNDQVGSKIIDCLEQKNTEYDKRRKDYTSTWNKEEKKLADARAAMKAAKAKYEFLGQDLVRVKNLLALDRYGKQADKRKKEVADYEARWQDAEMAYKNALAFCNDCQYQVHVAAKKSILCAYRRMIIDADTQLQSGLETYFVLQHNFFQTLTEPMIQNVDMVKEYNLGSDFMNYISRHPRQAEELEDYLFEEFDPEAAEIDPNGVLSDQTLPNSISNDSAFLPGDSHPLTNERPSSPSSINPSVQSEGGRSFSAGQAPSPHITKRWERPLSIATLSTDTDIKTGDPRRMSDLGQKEGGATSPTLSVSDDVRMSRNAMAHNFKKLRGPARCRECDTYVYFHGFECGTCGLACHRKCLATLAIKCGSKKLPRKMNTFGVEFQKHLKTTKRYIPIIVTECIAELDLRGLDTRGLYRVSSAKPKLEHLCQLFETGGDRVDLTDRPAHLIGSCLKLYFRQLPEPLLTFALYQDFVTFAREASYILPCNLDSLTGEKVDAAKQFLERLKGLLQTLPYENYITLAKLLYHLNRMSCPEHVKNNFMPPSNLGIVFAPNLLRQREVVPSLTLLADMTAQAKAVEIMISHVHDIIHVADDQIVEHEVEDNETNEVLVDDPRKSLVLDIEDALTVESHTPNTTPPERRKEHVSELSDVLDALQLVGRRSSHPSLLKPPHPQLNEVRNSTASTSAPIFSNLPTQVGGEKDTLATLGRLLRGPAPHNTPAIEKMLTPVQERQSDSESSDEEDNILESESQKIDTRILNRSESGLSNPSISWALFDADSEVSSLRDSMSILSEDDNSLPRGFRLNGRKNSKEEMYEPQQFNHKSSSQGSDEFPDNSSLLFASDLPDNSVSYRDNREGATNFGLDKTTGRPNNSSKENSFSEEFKAHSDATLKPSKANLYEKYERYRLANPISDSELGIEQSQGSTQSTQDSVGTLTDGVSSSADDTPPTVSSAHGVVYENGNHHGNEESTGDSLREKNENWKDMYKHVDSGIDERGSPDTISLKRSSFHRLFSEPVVFNSRESGLADSPDSESLLSETHPLNGHGPHSPLDTHSLATHVLRSPTDHQAEQSNEFTSRERRARSSEPELGGTHEISDIEIIVGEGKEPSQFTSDELHGSNDSLVDYNPDDCFNQSLNAPRSLESPLFSSIARNPIQRHAKAPDNPLLDITERRPRAASVEPCTSPKSFSPKHELHHKAITGTRIQTSTVTSPTHSTKTTSSTASSESDLSLPGQAVLSKSLSALTSPTHSSGGSVKKWGKRLQKKLKPALRVLKITPNSTPAVSSKDEIIRDIHLSSLTPENSPSPSELDSDRIRMMSPEPVTKVSMDTRALHSIQRSQSYDNILDVTKTSPESSLKIGHIQVVSETKPKKRTKLFSTFQGSRLRSRSAKEVSADDHQPVSSRKKKMNVDMLDKSPKVRKKSRLPHFV